MIKKISASLILGIILGCLVSAQTILSPGQTVALFSAHASSTGNSSTFAFPAGNVSCTWQSSFGSAPASVTLQILTSLDNSSFSVIDTSTVTTGESRNFNSNAKQLRARIDAISGGSAVTVNIVCRTTSTTSGGSGTPNGANTTVQFNDGGVFGGNSSFKFTKATQNLSLVATESPDYGVAQNRVSNYTNVTITAGTGDAFAAIEGDTYLTDTGNGSYSVGIQGLASITSTLVSSLGGAIAGEFVTRVADTSTADYTTSPLEAVTALIDNFGTGDVAQAIGVHIRRPTSAGGGAYTEAYGLLIENQTSQTGTIITTGYAIKTGNGLNSFGDDIVLATAKALKTDTTTAHTFLLQGYDNNTGPAYVTFATITNGNTPSFVLAPPAGGATVSVQGSYKSSDGSAGVTVAACTAFKDGLCVAGT